MANEWIEWSVEGHPTSPVSLETIVEVRFEDGFEDVGISGEWHWHDCGYNIVAYRVMGASKVREYDVGGSGLKDTNPKTGAGDLKVPVHLFPATAIAAGAMAFHEGRCKYGGLNWRAKGVRYSVYHRACLGHMQSAWEGETIDPDSGLPHLYKAIACLAILIDADAAGMLTDDRCMEGGYKELISNLTPLVKAISEMHSDKAPHHYTIADNK